MKNPIALALLALAPLSAVAQTTVQVPYSGSQPYSGSVQYNGSTPVTVNVPSGCTVAQSGTTINVTCGVTPPPPPPPPPPPGGCAVSVKPTGAADNASFNAAIAKAAGGCVEVTAGTYQLDPWNPPAGTNLALDDGVTINDRAGYSSFVSMLTVNASNITITAVGPNKSAGFTMPNSYATNIKDPANLQYNHCILTQSGASNVKLTGFWLTKCGGDGVNYAGGSGIAATNLNSSNNIRQGTSVTQGVTKLVITGGLYSVNHNSGIDIEPNAGAGNIDITLTNVTTRQNPGGGFSFGLMNVPATSTVSIVATGLVSDTDDQYGFSFWNANSGSNPSGSVTCTNCKAISSGFGGAYGRRQTGGWQMVFNGLTVIGANRNGIDPHYAFNSSIGVGLFGGESGTPGGVTWNNVTITGGSSCFNASGSGTAQQTTISGTCNGAAIKYP